MAERQRTEISTELLEGLRRKAEDQGRTEADVLDEAVRRYLERSGSLDEFLKRIDQGRRDRGVDPLSEDEAMRLAVEEQHAWRRERAG